MINHRIECFNFAPSTNQLVRGASSVHIPKLMENSDSKKKPGLLWSVLTNKCPRCRQGHLFKSRNPYQLKYTSHMPEHCPVCKQPFELHTGFYFGTGYVSYGLSLIVIGVCFALYAIIWGLSIENNSIYWALGISTGVLVVLQPVIQRLSRSIWIAIFVHYDPDWDKNPPQRQ